MKLLKALVFLLALCQPLAAPTLEPAELVYRRILHEVGTRPPVVIHHPPAADVAYSSPFRGQGYSRISSGFGWRRHPILGDIRRHRGLDIPRPQGTMVYAAQNGQVVFSGWRGNYGRAVMLRHREGAYTVYGHLSRILVAAGQWVDKNKPLGLVGSTGLSTGPHLHFEYRDSLGRALDPRLFISRL